MFQSHDSDDKPVVGRSVTLVNITKTARIATLVLE